MKLIKVKALLLVFLIAVAAFLFVLPAPVQAGHYSYINWPGSPAEDSDGMFICFCLLKQGCYCRMKVDLN